MIVTIIVWVASVAMFLLNTMQRKHIQRLETRLIKLTDPDDYLNYLRQQAAIHDKGTAIKVLRKEYPEVSVIKANKLWQLV